MELAKNQQCNIHYNLPLLKPQSQMQEKQDVMNPKKSPELNNAANEIKSKKENKSLTIRYNRHRTSLIPTLSQPNEKGWDIRKKKSQTGNKEQNEKKLEIIKLKQIKLDYQVNFVSCKNRQCHQTQINDNKTI